MVCLEKRNIKDQPDADLAGDLVEDLVRDLAEDFVAKNCTKAANP
jgi:hypothetical protein